MLKIDESRIFYWGLVCLLAFSPLVRGGHQIWAALLVTGGIGCLLIFGFIRNLWRGSLIFVWSPQDLLFLVGLAWVAVSLGRSLAPPDASDSFLILLGCVGVFWVARSLSSLGQTLNLVTALSAIGAMIVLVGLGQLFGFFPHDAWNPKQFLASTFVNHNHFAAYLELIFPASLLLWLMSPIKRPRRYLLMISSGLMGIGLIVSCSRGAWLSLFMTLLMSLVLLGFKRIAFVWNPRRTIALIIFVMTIGLLAIRSPIFARGISLLNPSNDTSIQMREAMWKGTWDLMKANLIFGQGAGSFLYAFLPYRPAGLYRLINYAHNEYFQLVAEFGVIGLGIAISTALFVFWRMTCLARLSKTRWKRAVGLGGLIGLGSLAFHSLVDFPWHIPAVAYEASAVAGLVMGVVYHADPHPLRTFALNVNVTYRTLMRKIAIPLISAAVLVSVLPFSILVLGDLFAYHGDLKFQAGKFGKACRSYRKAIRLTPFRVKYYQRLGESLNQLAWRTNGSERLKDFNKAAHAYQKALKLVPHDAWSAYALGEILKTLGDLKEADHWLGWAATWDPQNPLYWKDWGELKLLEEEVAESSKAFRRAAELAKPYNFFPNVFGRLDDPEYFIQRGESALALERVKLARTNFAVAKEYNPNYGGAQVGFAISSLQSGDFKKARQTMSSIYDPALKAKWFAALARYRLGQGKIRAVKTAIRKSLKLDPSNLLARQLQFVLTKQDIDQLLLLNQPPIFVHTDSGNNPTVIWEPEKGHYQQGQKIKEGWGLFNNGSIRQTLALPPGRVKFRVRARGTKAKGKGPNMTLFWNERPVFTTEVASENWHVYEFETEVKPGESILVVDFNNDFRDPLIREDRNLKLDKIVANWEHS